MITRSDYDEYARRFNAREYDGVFDFYAPEPRIAFFGVEIRSRDDLKRFYGFLHQYVRETIRVQEMRQYIHYQVENDLFRSVGCAIPLG